MYDFYRAAACVPEVSVGDVDYNKEQIKVFHTTEVITGEDSPVKAVKRKKDSSMVKGIESLTEGQGDLFVSAGNTGALLAGGIFVCAFQLPCFRGVFEERGDEDSGD